MLVVVDRPATYCIPCCRTFDGWRDRTWLYSQVFRQFIYQAIVQANWFQVVS